MTRAGEWAALLTAVCWTVSAMSFSLAGERIGSIPVNVLRFAVALPLVIGLVAWQTGSLLPLEAPPRSWALLLLSGVAGYFFGDLCLFRALVEIGPRHSLLVMSLAPPLTVVLAAVRLGERLSVGQYGAMAVTLAGVMTVVTEREEATGRRRGTARGYALALGGSMGQAFGMVLAKEGLPGFGSVWGASALRMLGGATCFALLAIARREGGRLKRALRDHRALALVALGALMGPFLGVTLMLYALSRIPAGLAQTFAATTPVLILPLSRAVGRERITSRALIGAVLAVLGVALLFRRW
ncbi:MAG: DMT family transporter [Kiritimatiellae bacterium]|nr:DMT family transporter [Kiritimatiellia bacterium]